MYVGCFHKIFCNSHLKIKYFLSLQNKKIVYWVPVSVTSQLKVVRVPVFAAAVSVIVAWIEAPAFRTVFSRFHVRVR